MIKICFRRKILQFFKKINEIYLTNKKMVLYYESDKLTMKGNLKMKYKELVAITNINQTISIRKYDKFNSDLLRVIPGSFLKDLNEYNDMEVVSFSEVNDCLTIYLK